MEHIPFADLGAMTREVREEVDGAWRDLLDANDFVRGPAVDRFEQEWADYCGTSRALGVANGTDALHLVMRALGIGPGDEVIVPANTFIATAEAVLLAGATPRFADVHPGTLLLTAESLERALTPRTRAVVAVHLFGQMVDMPAVMAVATAHDLLVVEDAAQAHGAMWGGRRAGSFGEAGCFSFYPGKNLGAFGDGGAVVTSNEVLAARVHSLRDHGRVNGSHYDHVDIGTNSRLDTIQAAVLSAKLRRLDAWTSARQEIARAYRDAFAGTSVVSVAVAPEAEHVYHLAVVRVPERDRVRRELQTLGISTGVHYPTPCHLVGGYRPYAYGPLPEVERASGEILSLPMSPHMTREQVERVCETLLLAVGDEEVFVDAS